MRNIPFGKPIIDNAEKNAVFAVMDSGIMVHGPKIKEFEDAFSTFTGANYAVGVSSCTAALHLAYFSLDIGSGDEVIVPAMTHTATAHAVELLGAKPIFVDADATTGNIDIAQIEAKLTSKTKAISVVHYLGLPVDMESITAIARKYDLKVIEDCALSIGAYLNQQHTGLFGLCGCFSFYPVKHMTTAEGGMLITNSPEFAAKIEYARAFGIDRHHGERKIPGLYDATTLGFNYRMSEIHAAIGVEQLKKLPSFLETRKTNFKALTKNLSGILGISLLNSADDKMQSSFYSHLVILDPKLAPKRPDIMNSLMDMGIGCSIYYPHPVPRMSYYKKKYGYNALDYPNAERISDAGIALPVGPHLNQDDMLYITEGLNKAISKTKKYERK